MPPVILRTHAEFEDLWFARKPDTPPLFLIWFAGGWSTPCQRMDKYSIEAAAQIAGVPLYFCHIDYNTETPRFCNIWVASTFLLCAPQKQLAQISTSDTYRVARWVSIEVPNARSRLGLIRPPLIRGSGTKSGIESSKTI
jgi:hypothetical protein